MCSQGERTHSKAAECMGKAELAEQETKDSKPVAVKYCGGGKGRRNFQAHRRVRSKVGLEQSKRVALFPLL